MTPIDQPRSEQWRDIPGFEGIYQASNLGIIRSIDRIDARGNRRRGQPLQTRHHLSGIDVGLTKNARQTQHFVRRLVLQAFVGPCPDGMEARHINGDPTDCRLSNLEWATRVRASA